jgi:hypothetical protein
MDTPPALSIYANQAYDSDGAPIATLGIDRQDSSVVVWVRLEEIDLFAKVRDADWQSRGSIHIGQCVGSPVFWCAGAEKVSLLIGPNDETWGVAMSLPLVALDQISKVLHEHKDWLSTTSRFISPPRRHSDGS